MINPEVEAAVKRQKAKATISSLLIAILAVVLVGILLFLFAITSINLTQPDIVAYQASAPEDQQIEQKQINPSLQRKPAAPSSSMAKVISANTASPTAIPVPDFDSPVESVDFGDGADFGAGWGTDGEASSGGGTSFFGQKSSAERIAFVIDYSLSMKAQKRVDIMKAELTKSLKDLPPGTQYQMIFFAGPAWVAGSTIGDVRGCSKTMSSPVWMEKKYEWVGGKPKGRAQRATWLTVPSAEGLIGSERRDAEEKKVVKESLKYVKDTPLVLGTRWNDALGMAMDMKPPPQVIYFMTDGSSGKTAMDIAKTYGNKAKSRGITVNCIAMMEPRAAEAMAELAKRAGGKFTMVEKGGKTKEMPLN